MADSHDGFDTSSLKYYMNCCDIQFRGGAYYYLLYEKLKILSDFCRTIGLSGLVVLFDEVESIVTLLANILSRLRSYEILSKLTNHREFPYCCFFFAISPDFGHRIASWDYKYEYQRYKDYRPKGCGFMDSWVKNGLPLIQIPKINKGHNKELCSRLRGLHEHAYSWPASERVSLDFIESFIDEAEKRSLHQRDIVRSFVNILDVCQQHPSCDPIQELSLPVRMSVIERLRDRGLEVIDNRPARGALWVVGGLELIQLLQEMRNRGAIFRFASRGGQATKGRPAWWTRSQV